MKKLSVFLLFALFAVSCGGGDGSGTPITPPANTPDLLDDEGFPLLIPTKWTYLGTYSTNREENQIKAYIDYDSIGETEATGFTVAWILYTYTEKYARQENYFPIVWSEAREIYDCENEKWDTLKEIGKNLNREIIDQIDRSQESREWGETFSDTLGEDILNAVCDG